MSIEVAQAFANEVNTFLTPKSVLDAIGFHADKLQVSGTTIKAFCPIHQDSRFRSLLVDEERLAFRCTIKTCAGYEGGSLLELYAISRQISNLTAAAELAESLHLDLGFDWKEQLKQTYMESATSARESGDLTQAQTLLHDILEIAPNFIEARTQLAAVYLELGNPAGAIEEYSRLIGSLAAEKDFTQADAIVEKALELFPENEDLLFARVKLAEDMGQQELAIERSKIILLKREAAGRQLDNVGLLEQLVQKAPEEPEFALQLAGLYELQHNVRGASRQYENCARVYLAKGDTETGIELLEKVVHFNSENVRARLELAHELAKFGELDKARLHTFKAINQQVDQQDFGSATNLINSWLTTEPDNIEARELLARIFLEQEQVSQAAAYLVEGAGIAGSFGDPNRAADLLLRAKFLAPDDSNIRQKLIVAFTETNESQRAAFEMIDLAEILFNNDQVDEAESLLQNGINSDITLSLKLQMVTALANHGLKAIATEKLKEIETRYLNSAAEEEKVELLEVMAHLEPGNLLTQQQLIETSWNVSPERSAEAARDAVTFFLFVENSTNAESILETITNLLDRYVPAVPDLIDLSEQTQRIDLAGTIYQATIQGFAETDAEMALKTARRMLAIDPLHSSAASDIAFLLATLERPEEAAEQYGLVASMLLQAGDYENAFQYAQEAVVLNPDLISALAVQALASREMQEAGDTAVYANDLLVATRATDDPEAATTGYLAYTELYPDDDVLLKEAAERLKQIGASGGTAQLNARQAENLAAAGDWESARELLATAHANAPELPFITEQYGEACRVTGKINESATAYATAALSYFEKKDMNSAMRCSQQALDCKPTEVDAWESVYRAAEATGLIDAASQYANKISRHYKSAGSIPTSVRWAREWVRLSPGSPDSHKALGQALLQTDQVDDALTALSQAASLYLSTHDLRAALKTLGEIAGNGAFRSSDRETLAAILAQNDVPELHTDASFLLGKTFAESGQLDKARAVAADLERSGENNIAAILWNNIAGHESDIKTATGDYVQCALAYQSSGELPLAINALNAAVALGSPSKAVHELLGSLLQKENRHDEALPHQIITIEYMVDDNSEELQSLLQSLRTRYNESIETRIAIAKALYSKGRKQEALSDLEAAATLAINAGDIPSLITICGLDETLTKQSPLLTQARADALMGMENEQQALEWIQSSSRELLQAEKPAQALEMLRRWINLAPADIEAYRLFARASEQAGDKSQSEVTIIKMARLLASQGKVVEALHELDLLLTSTTDTEPPLQLKIEILKQNQQSDAAAETLFELGKFLKAQGNAEGAANAYQDALSIQPDNADALWDYSEILRNAGKTSEASTYYRRWLSLRKELGNTNEYLDDIRKLLEYIPNSIGLLTEISDTLLSSNSMDEARDYLLRLTELQESEGNYLGAAESLEKTLLHANTPDPDAHIRMAELYSRAASPGRAQDHLRTAANIYTDQGNYKTATPLLDRIVKLSGDAPLPEDIAALASAYSQSGSQKEAQQFIRHAIDLLSKVSGNVHRRELLLAKALEIDPLNADYTLQHMDLLPPGRAMTEGFQSFNAMNVAGYHDDAIRVISKMISLAPHDMSLRQELFQPLRKIGNPGRLRQELLALATDAIAGGDNDVAFDALDEAGTLAESASHFRNLAELNERVKRVEKAAEQFSFAALAYAQSGKSDQAIAQINRAVSAKPSAVSVDLMAELVRLLGEPVHNIAREQLRAELTARRHKQSQVLALALLETMSPEQGFNIIKTVATLGGSSFVVGIVNQRLRTLLEAKDILAVFDLISNLLEIAPDSPDAWHSAARIYNEAGQTADARRCALEAARLFHTAGAVIEEEDAYRIALEAEPDDLTVQMGLAEYLVREKRPEEAITMLQKCIASAETSTNSDQLLECLYRAVQIAPANTDLREKLADALKDIAPDSAIENWLEAARLYTESDHKQNAVRIYEHILQLHPTHEIALQELLPHKLKEGDISTAARLARTLADIKNSRKNVGQAVKILQQYLEVDPDNLDILERLASLAGTSNNQEVFTATTRALAQRLQKNGNYDQALIQYERLLERNPRDSRVLMTLIDCSAAAGLPHKGLSYARQLLSIAKETEDPERVRIAAGTILNYEPEDAHAHNDLGEALLSLNRVPEAVAEWLRAGETYEANGNTAAAYTCYRRITQINPLTIHAWKRLADLAITIGDLETARIAVLHILDKSADNVDQATFTLLNRLLTALPEDPLVHKTALDFYKRSNDEEKGIKEYLWLINQTAETNPESAENLISEALLWAPGNPELKQVQHKIIKQLGRLEELQLKLRREAELHETAEHYPEAIAVMEELVQLAPEQISVHRDFARLLEKAGRDEDCFTQNLEIIRLLLERSELEEARDMADTLAKTHSKDYLNRERIADLLAQSAFPDVAARHYMAAAKVAQAKKLSTQAIALLNKAVDARPNWPESRKALAEACEKAGRMEQAFEAWIGLSETLLESGEYSEAAVTLDKLAVQQPESRQVREQLASLYERTGNRTRQAAVLNELINLYEADRNLPGRLATLQKLIAITPDDSRLLTKYIELLFENGSEPPTLSGEYIRLADLLAKQGDVEGALQTYEQILGLAPDNTNVRSRYATFLVNHGGRNRALHEMRELATLYSERNDYAAAVEVLNAALAISPRDADLCLALAKAQEAAGMHEDARVSYSRATAILASTAAVKGIDTYRKILSQDENNTAVRLRLVELLINSGDKIEAAREARILAEIYIARGELHEAENAYRLVDECEPESLDEVKAAINRDSYDPSLQYVHYLRLGHRLMEMGDVDAALDTYRTARSLSDDAPEIIQKCIDCVSLIAPEAEAIPDYLLMAEKLLMVGDFGKARDAYEKVRLIDPFNNDARGGLESVKAAERQKASKESIEDELILRAGRTASKRVGLMDLLVACKEAASETNDDRRLGPV